MTAATRILGGNLPGYFPPIANSPQGAPSAIASWNNTAIRMKKQKMNVVSKGYWVIISVNRQTTDNSPQRCPLKTRFFEMERLKLGGHLAEIKTPASLH